MKLDERIEKLSDILTCVDIEEAKQFIGQKGYFSDCIRNFDDLSVKTADVLSGVYDHDMTFIAEDDTHWRYFIPECRLKPKEKKYRPYTLEEFLNEGFEVLNEGFEIIVFREKGNSLTEYHVRYNGYRKYENVYNVILGNISYTFDDLFEDFERFYNGRWFPFGVKEE